MGISACSADHWKGAPPTRRLERGLASQPAVQKLGHQILQFDPPQRGFSFQFAKQRVWQIKRRSHKSTFMLEGFSGQDCEIKRRMGIVEPFA